MTDSVRGIDLLNSANSTIGVLSAPLKDLQDKTILAISEILYHGARVRPLMMDNKLIGYARGLRLSEKAWLSTMYPEPIGYLKALLHYSTTLGSLIDSLSVVEFRRVFHVVERLGRADESLLPLVYPFSTTSASEKLAAVPLPPIDTLRTPHGPMETLGPSEIYLQWRFMCKHREDLKVILNETQNSVMIVQAWVGKAAAQMATELKNSQKQLHPNIPDPWMELGVALDPDIDFEDGWGHSHQDQSLDGLMREYNGMVREDKHEQLMLALAEKQRQELIEEREKVLRLKNRAEGVSYSEKISEEISPKQTEKERKERIQAGIARADSLGELDPRAKSWNIDL